MYFFLQIVQLFCKSRNRILIKLINLFHEVKDMEKLRSVPVFRYFCTHKNILCN